MKKLLVIMLILITGFAAFGQARPRLGILPFIGGSAGDAEIITTLLSFQDDILRNFTVVTRTNAVTSYVMENSYLLAGYPDSDNIARLGRMLNAEFMVSGYIRSQIDRNLLIVNIINVETMELLGGDYLEFRRVEEITSLLPGMVRKLVSASRRDTRSLPKLAVAPFNIARDVSVPEAETLAQLLGIEIANSGKYTLLPRKTTLEAAKKGLDNQGWTYTAEQVARVLGQAVNTRYVLTTDVQKLASMNMISASIMNIDDRSLYTDGSRNYRMLIDGVPMMAELSVLLTGAPAVAVAPPAPAPQPVPVPQPTPQPPAPQPEPEPVIIAQPAPEPEPEPEPEYTPEPVKQPLWEPESVPEPYLPQPTPPVPGKSDPAKFWTIGFSVGSSFSYPWAIATVHGTIAPFRHVFLELGCDIGFLQFDDRFDFYFSLYPYAHLNFFLPFGSKGGWYIGTGAGYMMHFFFIPGINDELFLFAADVTTGVNLFNILNISYTLRAAPWEDLKWMSHKASIGLTYRF